MPFVCYDVSLQVIRALRPVLEIMKTHDRELAEQMRDAASSVTLNLAEGSGCSRGRRRNHNEIAHGSAREVMSCLDVGEAWGWLDASTQRPLVDRLLRLLWGLTRGAFVETFRGKPKG